MKHAITFTGKYMLSVLFFLSFIFTAHSQLLYWDANSNGGGFGASPWTPAMQNTNISTSGLVRGASIGTSGTPAGGAWGGASGWSAGSGATTDNSSFHFTIIANTGFKISLSGITTATRRSNSGPTGYTLYYSVNGGTFSVAGTATTTSTSGTTGTTSNISLSGISALQNVPAGTVIKFRINPTGSSGNYYLTGGTNALRVNGTVQAAAPNAPVATDATDILTAGFTANWNAVAGATGYRIDIATDAGFTNILENYDNFAVAGTSLLVSMDISGNTTYYYRVRTEEGALSSNNSNIIEVTTICTPVTPPTAQAQTFCGTVTITQLSAQGTGIIKWYSAENGGTALSADTQLATGTYYASQTAGGCESTRTAVQVTVNPQPAVPVAETQIFCGEGTIAALQVTSGQDVFWYDAETGGTALAGNTVLATGIYYVSQTVNGCESQRAPVSVTIHPIPAAPLAEAQMFCGDSTVAGLEVITGATPLWYAVETGGATLAADATLATGTYYVSQTINGCEGPRTAVSITVNPVTVIPTAEAQMFCGQGTIGELEITAGQSPLWYSAETGGTVLTADTALSTGTYYVSQTVNGCESNRATVQVTVNQIPDAPDVMQTIQEFCNEATLSNIVTDAQNVLWYTSPAGGNALPADAALTQGTSIYYASQTVNGCESILRTAVAVVLHLIDAPVIEAQDFCGAATVANIDAGVQNAVWYSNATGGIALSQETALATGTYYAAQIVGDCESSQRTAVAITVNSIPVSPTAEAQTFCGSATVGELTALTGENIQWYSSLSGGTALTQNTIVTTGNYYASQTINGCESGRIGVVVTVNTLPEAPAVQNEVITICNNGTVADLNAEGENILWYNSSSGGTALAENEPLSQGISVYYASQTTNGCESSSRTAVAVLFNTTEAPSVMVQSFCNDATVAELEADGENLQWYSSETGGTALTDETALSTGNYYVSQTVEGCESPRMEIAVTVTVVDIPVGEPVQEFIAGETLADIELEGNTIIWYADEGLNQVLEETTVLADATTYYAVAGNGECTSDAFAVTVNEVLSVESFNLPELRYYPNPVKDVVTVSFTETISSVTVYNLMGQAVIEKPADATTVSIDLSELSAGTYILKISAANSVKTVKVIKQ